jgi:hypothetical protein
MRMILDRFWYEIEDFLIQTQKFAPTRIKLRIWEVMSLLAEVSFDATTCPMTLGSASPRGELRCYHVSHGSGLCLHERGAPVL